MKPRHAAALALVGWYLIMAPAESFRNHQDDEEPLGKWILLQTFDTELECKQKLSKGCRQVGHGGVHTTIGFEGPMCYARCIATDDSRLKGELKPLHLSKDATPTQTP